MALAFTRLAFCLAAVLLSACAGRSLGAPRVPSLEAETRALPSKSPREIPRLIAPPPAYGNKIVMALNRSAERVN